MESAAGQTRILWPGVSLQVTNSGQWLQVDTPEPDPDWRYVDAAGHGHFWQGANPERGRVSGGNTAFPTLVWKSEPCTMGHGPDCDSEGRWECPACGEHIVPRTRPVGRMWMPGPDTFKLWVETHNRTAVYRFDEPVWFRLLARIAETVDDELADYRVSIEIRGGARR